MENIIASLDFIAVVLYASIAIFALIGGVLYTTAYFQMKRTRIIGAVALLLFGIGLDTFWWMLTEFSRFVSPTHDYHTWMVHPAALIVTKIIMLSVTVFFVVTSVKEDKQGVADCSEHLGKPKSNLRR